MHPILERNEPLLRTEGNLALSLGTEARPPGPSPDFRNRPQTARASEIPREPATWRGDGSETHFVILRNTSAIIWRLAGIAQLVEHLICNQVVGGSSPSAGTTPASSRLSARQIRRASARVTSDRDLSALTPTPPRNGRCALQAVAFGNPPLRLIAPRSP